MLHAKRLLQPILDATSLTPGDPVPEWVPVTLPLLFEWVGEQRRPYRERAAANGIVGGRRRAITKSSPRPDCGDDAAMIRNSILDVKFHVRTFGRAEISAGHHGRFPPKWRFFDGFSRRPKSRPTAVRRQPATSQSRSGVIRHWHFIAAPYAAPH